MATTRKLPPGNCAFCDSERGVDSAWGLSPEGWAAMKEAHDTGHPNWEKNRDVANQALEKMVEGMEEEAARKVENGEDLGHEKLLHDIEMLLDDAKACHFHDFHKNGLDMPKMALAHRLQKLIENVKDGRYDN